jgi:hypothetical protein
MTVKLYKVAESKKYTLYLPCETEADGNNYDSNEAVWTEPPVICVTNQT